MAKKRPVPMGQAAFSFVSLVGRGIQVRIPAPDHVLAQLGAHDLHLVLLQVGPLGVEEGAAVLVDQVHDELHLEDGRNAQKIK